MITNPPTPAFQFPTIAVDANLLLAYLAKQIAAHVQYGLGDKAASLSDAPGVDHAIDCSGEVRLLLFAASHGVVVFPDGSVTQHEACERVGFKPSTYADAFNHDGILRIGFLEPGDTPEKIGHVVLIRNGKTAESHGHFGPDQRVWGSQNWMKAMHIYVLTAPGAP